MNRTLFAKEGYLSEIGENKKSSPFYSETEPDPLCWCEWILKSTFHLNHFEKFQYVYLSVTTATKFWNTIRKHTYLLLGIRREKLWNFSRASSERSMVRWNGKSSGRTEFRSSQPRQRSGLQHCVPTQPAYETGFSRSSLSDHELCRAGVETAADCNRNDAAHGRCFQSLSL